MPAQTGSRTARGLFDKTPRPRKRRSGPPPGIVTKSCNCPSKLRACTSFPQEHTRSSGNRRMCLPDSTYNSRRKRLPTQPCLLRLTVRKNSLAACGSAATAYRIPQPQGRYSQGERQEIKLSKLPRQRDPHPRTYLPETDLREKRHATNQPKDLPLLQVFRDLRFSLCGLVAQDLGCVLASTGKMSRLHAAALPADFSANCQTSLDVCGS